MENQPTDQVLPCEVPRPVRTRRPLLFWGRLLAGWLAGSFGVAEWCDFQTMQYSGHHSDGEAAWFCFTRSFPIAVAAGAVIWFVARRPIVSLIVGALAPGAVLLWMDYVVKW